MNFFSKYTRKGHEYDLLHNKKPTSNLKIKYGRPVTRIKLHPENYDIKMCNGIYNKDILRKKFEMYKELINTDKDKETNPVSTDFRLVPYCGEFVNISKLINKVNESAIEKDITKQLGEVFGLTIDTRFENEGIIKTKTQFVSEFNPAGFKTIIDNPELRKLLLNGQKHAVTVVHSHFLRNLTTLYGSKVYFDNLDILHIVITKNQDQDQNQKETIHLFSRRFIEFYGQIRTLKDTTLTEENYKEQIKEDPNPTHIFLVRHCVGCHNIIQPVLDSRPLAHIKQKLKGELGYSLYSICSDYTITEMIGKRESLIKLFTDTCGALINIQFGSSCILRAIVTGVLLITILRYEQKSIGKKEGLLDLTIELDGK
jgi:hypothetical protein